MKIYCQNGYSNGTIFQSNGSNQIYLSGVDVGKITGLQWYFKKSDLNEDFEWNIEKLKIIKQAADESLDDEFIHSLPVNIKYNETGNQNGYIIGKKTVLEIPDSIKEETQHLTVTSGQPVTKTSSIASNHSMTSTIPSVKQITDNAREPSCSSRSSGLIDELDSYRPTMTNTDQFESTLNSVGAQTEHSIDPMMNAPLVPKPRNCKYLVTGTY